MRKMSSVIALAKLVIIALLMLLLLAYGIGSMLSGALGEADDAKGPILSVGPLSVAVSLIALWRFNMRLSAWALALAVLTCPFWSVEIFGPASEQNLWPFWAEAAVVVSWPVWGFLLFRSAARAVGNGLFRIS
jgi:hypothetical protein